MTDRELMQQALDALDVVTNEVIWDAAPIDAAIDALRAALAQPAEPVACFINTASQGEKPHWEQVADEYANDPDAMPLYTHPPLDGFGGNLDSAFDVPGDTVIVPREPTADMLTALSGEWHPSRYEAYRVKYRAMIAAAPAQPAPEPLTLTQATAPREIWLQISDDDWDSAEPFPDSEVGITWCQDSVVACEVRYVRADLAAHPAPVVPDGCCRNELLTALHSLASNYENALGMFGDDGEGRRKAEGDLAHAMKVAAKHNRNGPGCAAPAVREPKPLAAANRYCASGMCLPKDKHEVGCTAHAVRGPVSDPDCEYWAPEGQVCTECGRIHTGDSHG